MEIKWHTNEELQKEPLPAFCEICESIMFSIEDEIAFDKHKCCKWCSMIWAAQREQEWNDGWRPSEEQIKNYRDLVADSNPEIPITSIFHEKMDKAE